jgi:hypothetical protein
MSIFLHPGTTGSKPTGWCYDQPSTASSLTSAESTAVSCDHRSLAPKMTNTWAASQAKAIITTVLLTHNCLRAMHLKSCPDKSPCKQGSRADSHGHNSLRTLMTYTPPVGRTYAGHETVPADSVQNKCAGYMHYCHPLLPINLAGFLHMLYG